MLKKSVYLLILLFLLSSCGGDTLGSVKRGLTGAKKESADEFLVKKKDPLVLPPDFESLPKPEDSINDDEDKTYFEKSLKSKQLGEITSSTAKNAEESILQKIRKK